MDILLYRVRTGENPCPGVQKVMYAQKSCSWIGNTVCLIHERTDDIMSVRVRIKETSDYFTEQPIKSCTCCISGDDKLSFSCKPKSL